jgi:hypothetical protein
MRGRIGTLLAAMAMILFLFSTVSLAAGDKVRGDKGKGTVSTGTTAKGKASQPRTGR